MVYRGKPAKGCKSCRQRRIKCDLKPGSCGPCRRAQKECSGYRNELDTMFLDQTAETVGKATSSQSSRRPSRAWAATPAKAVVSPAPQEGSLFVIADLARPNIDDVALEYCYAHHIVQLQAGASSRKATTDETLLACLRALGMASYAVNESSPESINQARQYYGTTIKRINAALRSPEESLKDSTLMVVVALSYFEVILGDDGTSMAAWSQHLDGTVAIIALRGLDQTARPEGLILFLQAASEIVSKCIRLRRRLPTHIRDTMKAASKHVSQVSDPLWKMTLTMHDVTDFYSDVMNGKIKDGQSIIDEASRLDLRLASTFDDAIPAWEFQVKKLDPEEASQIYPGYVHVYQNTLSAQAWNSMRNGRIMCNAIVLGTLRHMSAAGKAPEDAEALQKLSASIIADLSKDILASVPQHVGYANLEARGFERLSTSTSGATKVMDYEAAQLPVLRTSGGYLLVWALGLVAGMAQQDTKLKSKACKCLRLVGKSLNIRQALLAAENCEKGRWKW